MFESKFEYKIYLLFAPNEIDAAYCCSYDRYSEAIKDALKNFPDGFEIYECHLMNRFICKAGENDV